MSTSKEPFKSFQINIGARLPGQKIVSTAPTPSLRYQDFLLHKTHQLSTGGTEAQDSKVCLWPCLTVGGVAPRMNTPHKVSETGFSLAFSVLR